MEFQGQMSNEPLLELLGASFMSCGLMCEAIREPPQECLGTIMLQVFRVIANAFDCDQVKTDFIPSLSKNFYT